MTEWTNELAELARANGYRKEIDLFRRPSYLSTFGPEVKTVFDVGVSRGTRPLYVAFPQCDFILIDPNKAGESIMRYRPEKFTYLQVALGSRPDRLTLNDNVARSSLLERTALSAEPLIDRYEVEVTTFRDVVEQQKPAPRFGVKIDTEGYELEVIKGMVGCFENIDFLICETSIRRLFEGGYQFSDLVSLLRDNGMYFYNFLNHPKSAPRFYDTVFLPRTHPLFG